MTTVRLVHGDAAAALRALPMGSIRLVVTDPPYRTFTRGDREISVMPRGPGFRTLGWRTIAGHLAIARKRLQGGGHRHARRQPD